MLDSILKEVKGTSLVTVTSETIIPVAAKFKAVEIKKTAKIQAVLYGTVKDYEIYKRAVERSAAQLVENEGKEIDNFQVSENWFFHENLETFSIVSKRSDTGKKYLYHKPLKALEKSRYFIDGIEVEKDQIKPFLTPSTIKAQFEPSLLVYNKTNDLWHKEKPKVLSLENIKALAIKKQNLSIDDIMQLLD